MEGDLIRIRESLIPLSWLYGGAVRLRNFFFDIGLLKSRTFQVPVIAVGNITVGGTGKTPHVEYLVRLLKEKFQVAVLSRGYKRKTSGFIVADSHSTSSDIGDEPCQMKRKFADITVAVDAKRVRGIQKLTEADDNLDVVLLDDAFQHRYVKPGVNILLVDYHRLIIYDRLLPAGRLREPLSGKNRADIVIVTKCPQQLKPMEFRVITKAMNLYPYQHLYFTTLRYGKPYPLFDENDNENDNVNDNVNLNVNDNENVNDDLNLNVNDNENANEDLNLNALMAGSNVLLLTGIASPQQLHTDLEAYSSLSMQTLTFADHHNFRAADIRRINDTFAQMSKPAVIITTEKDATRLSNVSGLSDEVRSNIYVLPVSIRFMQQEQEQRLCEFLRGYVLKNSRHSTLNTKR